MKQKQPEIPETFKVVARTPGKIVYEGMCRGVSGENTIGPFTVLPGHQNFVTNIIRIITLHLEEKKQTLDIPVQVGVLHVKNGVVLLYIILQPDDS